MTTPSTPSSGPEDEPTATPTDHLVGHPVQHPADHPTPGPNPPAQGGTQSAQWWAPMPQGAPYAGQAGWQGYAPQGTWGPYPQAYPTAEYRPVEPTPPAGRGSRLAAAARRPRTRVALAIAAAVVLGAGAGAGVTAAVGDHSSPVASSVDGSGSLGNGTGSTGNGTGSTGNGTGSTGNGTGSTGNGSTGGIQGTFPGAAGNGSTGTSSSVSATATQSVGVVDIDTVVGYENAEAAGTGLVLTRSGEILTNNHVVDGATKITVTVVSTGKNYTATVVGTSPTNDIAVLQLSGASNLATANLGDSSTVDVGEAVTGVGNAGGKGGTPSAATGTVTALDQTITASDGSGSDSETLNGMIVTDAQIKAGDSGGPLYDANNEVVGIDTAAATSGTGTTTAGYAIPIVKALTIAKQIESGQETATVHIGYPAFIGIGLSADSTGATVGQVYEGSPAEKVGLAAGDTITAVDGTSVSSATTLQAAIATHEPGDQVKITWTDESGDTQTGTATLVAGPAD